MREPDPLLSAVRAYAPTRSRRQPRRRAPGDGPKPKPRARAPEPQRRPEAILVFDTETTIDAAQALLVGAYRYYRVDWRSDPTLACVEEGVFVPDDLDQASMRLVERYVDRASPATDAHRDARRSLRLLSRTEFIREVFLAALDGKATVVGFNLPFDLARIAVGWGIAEMEGYEGGFSLVLDEYVDDVGVSRPDTAVPRQLVRSFDLRRARMRLGSVRPNSDPYAHVRGVGSFLDLRMLAHALSGEPHSLESACAEFAVPYRKRDVALGQLSPQLLDYCREDVQATAALWEALAREFECWHLQRSPTRVYSGASLAKAIVWEARIPPILARQPGFSETTLGYAMTAYFGGRSEVRVRCQPLPVTTLDFRSMHPTVAVLTGLSEFLTCAEVDVVKEGRSAVAALPARLGSLTVDDCLEPTLWASLNTFVLVEPDGEVLPVRARYSPWGGYGIGVNPLWSEEPLWFTFADLVAAKLLTGRAPRIRRAIRLVPRGRLERMRALRIRDARPIDPTREDVFKALVEERRRNEQRRDAQGVRTAAALKVVANCLSYGIWGELNRQEPTAKPTRLAVNGLDRFYADVYAVEDRGEYFFGAFAALVAGGARLMLAILERLVADAGGAWAACDTDGMAVVATRRGELIPCPGGSEHDRKGGECVRALSWTQVDGIVERLEALNPYDRSVVPGSILSLEPENYTRSRRRRRLHCYAISAKRYCLYTLGNDGKPTIVKASKHALGGIYLDPRDPDSERQDWVEEAWAWILAEDALGIDATEPTWLDLPALSRFTASHRRLLRPFDTMNGGRAYAEQVKPYGFLLVAHAASGGLPGGADPEHFVLVAPFESHRERWADLPWRNIYDPAGPTYRLETRSIFERRGYALGAHTVAVRTYRDVLRSFRTRPESKSDRRHARGLLVRRPVRAVPPIAHIGKEANVLDQVAAGLVARDGDALTVYAEKDSGMWSADFVRVLKEMNVRETARAVGVNPTTITRIRSGSLPRASLNRTLKREIARYARVRLREGGFTVALDDESVVRVYALFRVGRLPT